MSHEAQAAGASGLELRDCEIGQPNADAIGTIGAVEDEDPIGHGAAPLWPGRRPATVFHPTLFGVTWAKVSGVFED